MSIERMSPKFFILHFVFVLNGLTAYSQQRPNIVFVYTDDQAAWTIGAYGNQQAYTPNIDKLAREGVLFKNAVVTTPVCSPSRVSIMTSQYASEYGIKDFIVDPGHKLYKPSEHIGLDTSVVTFAEVLLKSGYKTALIGKWHMGDWTTDKTKMYHPKNYGFQYFFGLTGGGTMVSNAPLETNDGMIVRETDLTDDRLTDVALQYISDNKSAPFLLCLNLRSPHTPWLPVADEDARPYEGMEMDIPNPDYPDLDTDKVKKQMKAYLSSVSGVDRNLGRVMAKLEELGLNEKTIIIFTSDHGYNIGHNGIEHKGNGYWITKTKHPAIANIAEGSRPNLYENSLRTPAIVKMPHVAHRVITERISNLDWYPTIVEMANQRIPARKIIRGNSLLPLMKGENISKWNNEWYAEYSMIHYSKADLRSYNNTEWKLVLDFLNPDNNELYHLSTDPEESQNLIHQKGRKIKKVIKKLSGKIKRKMKLLHDPLLNEINARNKNKN